jgi:hypothetical protein
LQGGVTESVRLGLEEAFFLHFALSVLMVAREVTEGKTVTLDAEVSWPDMSTRIRVYCAGWTVFDGLVQAFWKECASDKANFPVSYAAYHHLRAKVVVFVIAVNTASCLMTLQVWFRGRNS